MSREDRTQKEKRLPHAPARRRPLRTKPPHAMGQRRIMLATNKNQFATIATRKKAAFSQTDRQSQTWPPTSATPTTTVHTTTDATVLTATTVHTNNSARRLPTQGPTYTRHFLFSMATIKGLQYNISPTGRSPSVLTPSAYCLGEFYTQAPPPTNYNKVATSATSNYMFAQRYQCLLATPSASPTSTRSSTVPVPVRPFPTKRPTTVPTPAAFPT